MKQKVGFFKFFIFFTSVLLWGAGIHSPGQSNSGSGHGHWRAPEEAAQTENPVEATNESIEKGRALFLKNCTTCHGKKARGNGPAASGLHPGPANLVEMAGHHTDGDFAWKIRKGKGSMPGWEDEFDNEQIWHLVNFIQSLEANSP